MLSPKHVKNATAITDLINAHMIMIKAKEYAVIAWIISMEIIANIVLTDIILIPDHAKHVSAIRLAVQPTLPHVSITAVASVR
jgi:hypothetical protein